MSTAGWRKDVCVNGHVNPERTKSRACKQCLRESNAYRKIYRLSFIDSFKLINAIRHFVYGLDDLPWEPRSGDEK